MRVILDTNVWISYLLTPRETGTIVTVVRTCLAERLELVVPGELLDELMQARARKRYLRERSTEQQMQTLVEVLRHIGDVPAPLTQVEPLARDPGDDYLIAYALVGRVDYLVTGDDDLLALEGISDLRIVDPVDFLDVLNAAGLID